MKITGSMLAQLLQTGKLEIGCVELVLDPTLDFVRRFGKITVDFKIDSEPKNNIVFSGYESEHDK